MKILFVVIFVIYFTLFHTDSDNLLGRIFPFEKQETTVKPREIALQVKEDLFPESKMIDVPLLNQMDKPHLKNGCEVTSLAMLLNHNGIHVTKNELADKINRVPLNYPNGLKGNPNIGFVGNMADGPGLSVYNGPLLDLAKEYVGKKAVNLTNRPFEDLLKKVGRGIPVLVITTQKFSPGAKFRKWKTPQGTISVTLSGHSAVITGYDANHIYVNDPYGYKNKKITKAKFIAAWEEMGKQAIAIER